MNPYGILYGIALQTVGGEEKIVAVGLDRFNHPSDDWQWIIVRYNDDGSLDNSFGSGGKVTLFGEYGDGTAYDVAIDSLNRIVVTGSETEGTVKGKKVTTTRHITTIRLWENGSLDLGFGVGGEVVSSLNGQGRAVALEPGGKIVVSGWADIGGGNRNNAFVLMRYNSDGSLDTQGFGDPAGGGGGGRHGRGGGGDPFTGIKIDDLDPAKQDQIWWGTMALQDDGKIIVGGESGLIGGVDGMFGHHGWVLARYNSDGSADTSFGNNGKIFDDFPLTARRVTGLAIQPDGKILASGRSRTDEIDFDIVVRRYDPDGSVDSGFSGIGQFGVPGLAQTNIVVEDQGSQVAVQDDGKIVVGGDVELVPSEPDLIAFRFNSDGLPDIDFGNIQIFGTVGQSQPAESGSGGVSNAIALDSQGRIIVAGWANSLTPGSTPVFMLARYFK